MLKNVARPLRKSQASPKNTTEPRPTNMVFEQSCALRSRRVGWLADGCEMRQRSGADPIFRHVALLGWAIPCVTVQGNHSGSEEELQWSHSGVTVAYRRFPSGKKHFVTNGPQISAARMPFGAIDAKCSGETDYGGPVTDFLSKNEKVWESHSSRPPARDGPPRPAKVTPATGRRGPPNRATVTPRTGLL